MKMVKVSNKCLILGVIVLFLGLAVAPSINANIGKASVDSELVEITTEVCGLNGGKYTVQLTKEEAEEIEQLFDSIRERLNATETREEAEQIFNEAVVELDKYGLLGRLSVKQAQRLVTGGYQNLRVMKLMEKLYSKNQGNNEITNLPCLVAGETTSTIILGPSTILRLIANFVLAQLNYFVGTFFINLGVNPYIFYFIEDFLFYIFQILPHLEFGVIAMGLPFDSEALPPMPAHGWVSILGLRGVKSRNGTFYGWAIGFTGIKLGGNIGWWLNARYLGAALAVKTYWKEIT